MLNRISRPLALASATLALAALSACASPSTHIPPVDLSFRDTPALPLNVSTVNVTDESAGTAVNLAGYGANVTPPATAFKNYANQRFRAAGYAGFLTVTIQQASLTSQQLPGTGGWSDNFRMGNPTEHTVNLRIGLNLSGTGQPDMKSAYTLERKATIPADASIAQREHDINALIADTILDMDTAITQGLTNNMRIVTTDGFSTPHHVTPTGVTYGNPVPLR